jgi:hypothetical protein
MHREISRDRPAARGDLQRSDVTSFVDGLKVICATSSEDVNFFRADKELAVVWLRDALRVARCSAPSRRRSVRTQIHELMHRRVCEPDGVDCYF